MYRPVELHDRTNPTVATFVRNRVDPYLADVHAMLHMPAPALRIAAGCNFAIAEVLCAVIAGLSRVGMPSERQAKPAFLAMLRHYPVELEPPGLPTDVHFPEELYQTYRCNLVHSLGLNLALRKNGGWEISPLSRWTQVHRLRADDQAALVSALELEDRPLWLPPTLRVEGRTLHLSPEALYWGVRELLRRASVDATFEAGLVGLLRTKTRHVRMWPGVFPRAAFVPPTDVTSTTTAVVDVMTTPGPRKPVGPS